MKLTEIGNTGIKIPPIIFGTSALGNLYAELPFETKLEIVKQSIENVPAPVVFDSAGKYGAGLALEMLGKCLEELNIAPEDVVISNKLGWKRVPLTTLEPTFEQGVWMGLTNDATQDISYDGIIQCYEQGNKLLGGKYSPQLVSVHDPDEYLEAAPSAIERDKRFTEIVDAYRALHDLKKSGQVTAIGVGAKNWKVIEEISKAVDLDWVMFANSMTIMHHPQNLLDFMQSLHNKNISIVNSAVFHAGFLIGGKYFDYRLIEPDTEENKAIFRWREVFFELCKKHNISPAVACVSFAMTAPGVIGIALNTSNPKHVKGNVDSVITKVPDEFWFEMKEKRLINIDYPYL
jgi:D-threo-aldose 1-dehydrogenase